MFCGFCGKEIADGSTFCAYCGQAQYVEEPAVNEVAAASAYADDSTVGVYANAYVPQPVAEVPAAQSTSTTDAPGYMSFGASVKRLFQNLFKFNTRASKSEYWWDFLFMYMISSITVIPYIGWLIAIMIVVPMMYLESIWFVRRLNDVGLPWANVFKLLIPVYSWIYLFQVGFMPSKNDD